MDVQVDVHFLALLFFIIVLYYIILYYIILYYIILYYIIYIYFFFFWGGGGGAAGSYHIRVPYWGPYFKGVLLFGVYIGDPLIS